MSQVNNNKISGGHVLSGAMVMLSGFVPTPQFSTSGMLVPNMAHADTVTVNVTGSFVSGVELANAVAIDFNKFVATASTGVYGIKQTANAAKTGGGVKGIAVTAPVRGKFLIKLLANQSIDITVSKIGSDITLGATGGGGKNGTLYLTKIAFGKGFDSTGGNVTATATVAKTTAKTANVGVKFTELSGAGNTITMGATLSWSGGRPVGVISNSNGGNIVLTITF